ncbi:hypothetical protein [Streptomyces sp. SBT349]|uniref:immunity protein TriTu family protein n=1 Tax=Streptomyces sp. SBT349 TaxID=1580539 RepID=UPI00066DDFE8|nr:hypothetical protein [Streptomyces sp. SBT349]
MTISLTGILEARIEKVRKQLEESGFTLELFSGPRRAGKESFAVYLQRRDRGCHFTVWNSGEVQVSVIDYGRDPSPRETYLSDVGGDRMESELQKVIVWVSSGSEAG